MRALDRDPPPSAVYSSAVGQTTESTIQAFARITFDPRVMGGKPCIRGMRVTAGMIVGLLAAGRTRQEVLELYPYLEADDIDAALAYAAWRVEEIDVPLAPAMGTT